MPESELDAQGEVGSRALVGAAVATTILAMVAAVSLGTPPSAADTGAQVVAWFREHRDGVRWFVWAITVGAPVSALMYALLGRLLPAPHRDVFLIGAVTIVVTTAVQAWTWGGLALHADELDAVARRTGRDSIGRASGRDGHNLWVHGFCRTRRCDEPTTRRGARVGLVARVRDMGRRPWTRAVSEIV